MSWFPPSHGSVVILICFGIDHLAMRLSIICTWNSTYNLHSYIEIIVIHSLPSHHNDTLVKSYTHLLVRGDDTAFILGGAKRGFQFFQRQCFTCSTVYLDMTVELACSLLGGKWTNVHSSCLYTVGMWKSGSLAIQNCLSPSTDEFGLTRIVLCTQLLHKVSMRLIALYHHSSNIRCCPKTSCGSWSVHLYL